MKYSTMKVKKLTRSAPTIGIRVEALEREKNRKMENQKT